MYSCSMRVCVCVCVIMTSDQVQVREDEEQKEKLSGIIDLLLAAGYFRARISSLPVFDKVK